MFSPRKSSVEKQNESISPKRHMIALGFCSSRLGRNPVAPWLVHEGTIPLLFALLLAYAPLSLFAQVTVTVPGQANIYGAGHSTPPGPGGSGGGVLPTLINLPLGTAYVTLTASSAECVG